MGQLVVAGEKKEKRAAVVMSLDMVPQEALGLGGGIPSCSCLRVAMVWVRECFPFLLLRPSQCEQYMVSRLYVMINCAVRVSLRTPLFVSCLA